MKDFSSFYRGSFINLCTKNSSVDDSIRTYFSYKNFSIIPFLKETNSFVLIVSDYPVDKGKLFKILDPYRKFSDTVLLLVLDNSSSNYLLQYSDFLGYGITHMQMVSTLPELIEELDKVFSHWVVLNNLINDESEKKNEL